MENLAIQGTKYTPDISLDADRNVLDVKGYSYPENAVAFYAPVLEWLDTYLERENPRSVEVNLELIYFNSSSSKILLDLFDLLEDHAAGGAEVRVNWIYDERNESAYEYLSPAYREATPYTTYARKLKGFGMWKQAVVNEAKCDEDRCIVTTELHLEIRAPRLKGPVETVAYNQERWIKDYENRQLWFVPNK